MEPNLLFSLAWVLCHLGLFLTVWRNRPAFRDGGGLLLAHIGSCLLLAVILSTWLALDPREDNFAGLVGGIALHAVYSLSSLELWALSKTGFSLRILAGIAHAGPRSIEQVVRHNAVSSDRKKSGRLGLLIGLKLIGKSEQGYVLTAAGRCAAAIVRRLSDAAGLRDTG